jgi:PEP-CTERM motif
MRSFHLRRGIRLGALAAGLLWLLGASAQAVPISWTIDYASSSFDISLTVLGSTGTGTGNVAGTEASDVIDPLGPSPSLEFTGGSLSFDDTAFVVSTFLGALNVNTLGIQGALTGGPSVGTPAGSGPWTVDLAGMVLTLDQGFIDTSGLSASSTDLSVSPVMFTLGTTLATLTETGGTDLALAVPVSLSTVVVVSGINVTVDVTGNLAMGATLVPEPGTVVLLASGLAGIALQRRRLRRA